MLQTVIFGSRMFPMPSYWSEQQVLKIGSMLPIYDVKTKNIQGNLLIFPPWRARVFPHDFM